MYHTKYFSTWPTSAQIYIPYVQQMHKKVKQIKEHGSEKHTEEELVEATICHVFINKQACGALARTTQKPDKISMMNIANQLHLTFKICFGPASFHYCQPFYCDSFPIFQQTLLEMDCFEELLAIKYSQTKATLVIRMFLFYFFFIMRNCISSANLYRALNI